MFFIKISTELVGLRDASIFPSVKGLVFWQNDFKNSKRFSISFRTRFFDITCITSIVLSKTSAASILH